MSLILQNCYKADLAVVEAIGCPPADGRWHPISHGHAIQLAKEGIARAGLEITHEHYALSGNKKQGQGNSRLFGELTLKGNDSTLPDDFTMALGIRNSFDKTIPFNICGGERVMVCGNMMMFGEFMVKRKHTTNILADLNPMVDDAINKYLVGFQDRVKEVAIWKETEVTNMQADHIIMEALQNGAITTHQVLPTREQWNNPNHPEFKDRTAWSLQNAFTEAQKRRNGDPNVSVDCNINLFNLFRKHFTPVAA
jgi:hypothetical protein